ncbi:hypothetical protein [Actinomarinicola tropica]|uniref:Uncharacterized protein n=1 Tax=Actinomarinicola tropica TaxID=2789776 RepID=A0A5Q2RH92_9ACTN|nr:hypothetical protein [Actinomarinicola tropica]QGG96209.1 hypothetical protein GH723_14470 [Actinomarinicola tropica]
MTRWHVHVVLMRARDVRKGDVVSRDANRHDGWFRVDEVRQLPDGTINVLDKGNVRGFIAGPFDLIGLQTPVQLPPEADVTTRRRVPEAHEMPEARTAAPAPAGGDAVAAREAAAEALQAEAGQVRGSLPSSPAGS